MSAFVLLDLDGTLVRLGWNEHSLRPERQRLREIIEELGLDPPFGHMVPALAEAGRRLPWVAAALDEFELLVAAHATACAGLALLLADLAGRPTAVVTNNGRRATERALGRVGLAPSDFGAIVSREEVLRFKPDPEPLRRAVEQLAAKHGPPEQVYMIGDAVTDLEAARALAVELPCAVIAIALLGGVSDEPSLRAAGADAICESLSAVIEWLPGKDPGCVRGSSP